MDAFDAAFGPAFKAATKAAGMTTVATITSGGTTADYDVGFVSPDMLTMDARVQSREFEIELLDPTDCPTLAEGDAVVIDSVAYYVRRAPFNGDPGADGYYRRALLSKVRA